MKPVKRRNASKLKPLTPDFSQPVPNSKDEQIAQQQRIIDALRKNCGEYKKLVETLKDVLRHTPSALGAILTPSHNPEPKGRQ